QCRQTPIPGAAVLRYSCAGPAAIGGDAMRDRPDTFSFVMATNAVDDSAGTLRALIDLAPIGLAQFDLEGRFLRVNDRLCDIFGCSREDLVARTFHEITFPEDLTHCLDLTAKL